MSLRRTLLVGVCAAVTATAVGLAAPKEPNPVVVIQTTMGDITIELFRDRAPKSVENFLGYVSDGFYTDTIFHRVINGIIIQGGGLTANLQRKPTKPPIENEATNGLRNTRGTVAMARTGEINSATSQFFINTADNASQFDRRGPAPADFGYAVFGRVTAGMNVVDKIERVKTLPGDVPASPVTITGVVLKTPQAK
jgi:cyclophilin family peptidyl-prolyl cis-trans isomerase